MKSLLLLIGAAVVTVLVYSVVRHHGFVYEDRQTLAPIQGASAWSFATSLHPGRSLSMMSLALDAQLFGFSAQTFHLGNLGWHLLNGLLMFFIGRALKSASVGLLAAAIFWLHPLNSEAVCYISARPDLVSTTFVLLAMLAWAHAKTQIVAASVAFILVLAAMAAKPSGVVGWLLIGFCGWLAWDRHRRSWTVLWSMLTGLLWLMIWPQLLAVWDDTYVWSGSVSEVQHLGIQAVRVLTLLVQIAIPIKLSVVSTPQASDWFTTVGCIIGLLWLFGIAWLARERYPQLWFGLGWVLISLLPRFILRLPEPIAEHQCYLGMAGVSLAIAGMVTRGRRSRESVAEVARVR